jgi:hypothetical protein
MFMQAGDLKSLMWGSMSRPKRSLRRSKRNLIFFFFPAFYVTMHAMEDTLIALKSGAEWEVKTIIGGPQLQEFADSIGADGFGIDAMEGSEG